ncbi:MAG: hypothetical protein A2Y00_03465 [Omnitrophica WOR_2 bacterium GWF2_43_52]|nr:MAG: hypothetical protein A2062_05160 [Omnitrophica WOR_2 bacterium GWA2_44_7]OGX15305.1 MAG: hypothetical protein A2Y01_00050 [Omnitrophica WOR_2 bacterium GWC2_44_8]OGX22492.1 MAG: hypothetical protein A2Y00_03465 [Omnitrophica WOR_2 bacterium GWF2_43_52]OGX53995.1 MAG: hypothetical protein A2460_04290 [Omnitrophica WOR_2 bacterium RIFOXYC2_FULL_43_9]HAH21505.1 hypothetical protein [Candidatus Omnitrophota bacterium]
MRKNHTIFSHLFVLRLSSFVLLSLITGCTTTYSRKSDPTQMPALEPAALLKFQDIPIPSGFAFSPDESYAFQSTNFRAGIITYKGRATGDQVVAFFKEQMPMYNWHLLNIVEHSLRMLSFEKEQETCVITVDEKGNKSKITLSIAPKSQGLNRKIDKPFK